MAKKVVCSGCGQLYEATEEELQGKDRQCSDCQRLELEIQERKTNPVYEFVCGATDCGHSDYPGCSLKDKPVTLGPGGLCINWFARKKQTDGQ
jgi:hypothetical protein